MNSEAYRKGLNSSLQEEYCNPYHEDSNEFDEYERGRTQKIKRSSKKEENKVLSNASIDEESFDEKAAMKKEIDKILALKNKF